MLYTDKSVPGGCFVALLGLVSWAYSALAAYGVWKAFLVRVQCGNGIIYKLLLHFGVSLVIGWVLIRWGAKLLEDMEPYDPWDPNQPGIKF